MKTVGRKKIFLVLILAVILTISFNTKAMASPAKDFVIAGNVELTGFGASFGIPVSNTWKLQADRINKKGGITVGGEKYLIKFKMEDNKFSAEGARSAAEKLIFRDKLKHMLGPVASTASAAVIDVTTENKVLFICMSSTYKVFNPNTKYSFKSHIPSSIAGGAYPPYMAKKYPDLKNWAYYGPDDESGKSEFTFFQAGLTEVETALPGRVKLVAADYSPRGITDHTPALTKLLAKNPDIISIDGWAPAESPVIVKQARELGYKGWIVYASAFTMDTLLNIAGKDNCYKLIHNALDVDKPPVITIPKEHEVKMKRFSDMFGDMKWFAENYKSAYGEKAPGTTIYALDMLPLLIQGILAANSFDTDKIAEALVAMPIVPTYYGMGTWMGKKTWGVNHQIRKPFPLYEVRYGENIPLEMPPAPYFP